MFLSALTLTKCYAKRVISIILRFLYTNELSKDRWVKMLLLFLVALFLYWSPEMYALKDKLYAIAIDFISNHHTSNCAHVVRKIYSKINTRVIVKT